MPSAVYFCANWSWDPIFVSRVTKVPSINYLQCEFRALFVHAEEKPAETKTSIGLLGILLEHLTPNLEAMSTNPLHCKKKVRHFPVPSRDVTDQTFSGREKLNYSRLGRVWSVTSRLGMGKRLTLFYSVCGRNLVHWLKVERPLGSGLSTMPPSCLSNLPIIY